MKKACKKMFLGMLLFLFLQTAKAVPLTVNGGWAYFEFPGIVNGTDPYAWFMNFEFTLTQNAILTVQDIGSPVDRFNVFDNDSFIFMTSAPSGGSIQSTGNFFNPSETMLMPEFSGGTFLLGAGVHTISGTNINFLSTDYGGGAFIRVDTISEPAILLLTATGLLLMFYYRTDSSVSVKSSS